MEAITIDVALKCWIVFWVTYWIAGTVLSWVAHVKRIRLVDNVKEVVSVVTVNMLWTLLGIVLLYLCPLRAMTDMHTLLKFIFTFFLTEIWFYHVHVLIHHPQLYSKIHKLHHASQNRAPWALEALYCTPYEAIVLNVFATSIGPVIFQIPPPYIYFWYFLVALNSVASHSSIKIPYLIEDNHFWHHKRFTYNYGTTVYLDWLYGTHLPESDFEKRVIRGEEVDERVKEEEVKMSELKKDVNLGNFKISNLDLDAL